MTKSIMNIGTTLSERPFLLPPDTVTSTLVTFGGKGMGKTNLGSVIVEELTRVGSRWAWMDPIGVSWGLRHSADGKGKGVQCLILGGVHGDLPIEPSAGAAVADVVIDFEHVNVLIDFSRNAAGEMWGPTEKVRFCTAYIKQLFRRQGELKAGRRRAPLFQVLDEAARYVPQTIPHGNPELAACVSAWEQAVEEGRNIGLGVGLWTLRSARLNKSVSELADALFAFRTVGPNSLQSIMDWLGQHADAKHVRELARQVRELDRGTALVVSPGWLQREEIVRMRMRETFDSSATPKAGERQRRIHGQGAKPDLASIRERMKSAVEAAKANDPKALHAELKDKQKQIEHLSAHVQELKKAKTPRPAKAITKIKIIKVPVLKDAQVKRLSKIFKGVVAECRRHRKVMDDFFEPFIKATETVDKDIAMVLEKQGQVLKALTKSEIHYGIDPAVAAEVPPLTLRRVVKEHKDHEAHGLPVAEEADPKTTLKKGERLVLTVVVQYQGADLTQISVLTGYRETSRRTYLQALGQRGLIRTENGIIYATAAGVTALGDFERLPTGDDLRRYWLEHLGGGEQKLLQVLCDNYPKGMSRQKLMETVNYKDTSMRTYLQRLQARKLIHIGDDGIQARHILFTNARG